jgi:hypothetical protein
VIDFGALPNSSNYEANNNAFQQAIDSAGRMPYGYNVYVPAGEYRLTKTIKFNKDGVKLYGDGYSTCIRPRNVDGYDVVFRIASDDPTDMQYENGISDIHFLVDNSEITLIQTERAMRPIYKNIRVRNNNTPQAKITFLTLKGTGDWGGGAIVDNIFTGGIYRGVLIDSVYTNATIQNSWFWGSGARLPGSFGVQVNKGSTHRGSSSSNSIINCDFEGFSLGVWTDIWYTRVVNSRFENLDTAFIVYKVDDKYITDIANIYSTKVKRVDIQ